MDVEPVWDESEGWSVRVALPAWSEWLGGNELVPVTYSPESGVESEPPSAVARKTLAEFCEDQVEMLEIMDAALRRYYGEMRPRYLDFLDDPENEMPEIPASLATLHELTGIFVHPVSSDGSAYLGLAFHADWEIEHGVGILLHGRRVVEVGGADTAFIEWVAEEDAQAS